jgi:glycerophosphoryl diester phosphodiesterase
MAGATARRPFVVAHRGASPLAPDNSLEAFDLAIEAGADMIEFDVRRTADDELIAFHDATVGELSTSDISRTEIAGLTGASPPLLGDVLALTRGRVRLDIELKELGYVTRVLDEVGAHGISPEQIVITSFLDRAIAEVKQSAPEIKCGLLLGAPVTERVVRTRISELFPVRRVRACQADFVAPHAKLARLGVLSRADAAGYSAYVWTVNDPSGLRRFLADPRVAAVITDDTALALAIRDRSGGLGRTS